MNRLSPAVLPEAIPALPPIQQMAGQFARWATQALLDEACLTPKPGLVDRRGSGVHRDLTLPLMLRSAHSLTPTFFALALNGWQRQADISLRQEIGALGRWGERQMLEATEGVNTHRGAIWALGLLVVAVAMQPQHCSVWAVSQRAATLARLPDNESPQGLSKGLQASLRYRVPGAREEAQAGFPHVLYQGLPTLHNSRRQGATEEEARLNALLAIMSSLTDTCVLSRGGMSALLAMHQGARAVLRAGGVQRQTGRALLTALETRMCLDNASPGGAADLLAATLFLDRIQRPSERIAWKTRMR